MPNPPRVSCLLPTRARHALLAGAVANFLAQDFIDSELVIVSEDGVPDSIGAALQCGRVRHVACPAGLTLGAKRNFAVEAAHGQILVHWDDDDRHAPDRVSIQVRALERPSVAVCGSSRVHFRDLASGACYEYRYAGPRRPWVYGATLAYQRAFWRRHPFEAVNVGEDSLFVWKARPVEVLDLEGEELCLCAIHAGNTSPKHPREAWWRRAELPARFRDRAERPELVAVPKTMPLRNVYACLVHERLDCVIDLVRNLHDADAQSRIVLYDGSARGDLLDARLPWSRWGAELCPRPQPMAWGKLHDFALDCVRHLNAGSEPWEALTIVDSDQLALRSGYPEYLERTLGNRSGLGLLASDACRQGPDTRVPPAVTAQAELALWRPFLARFPDGESKFVHWSFWPGTVLFRDAASALADLFAKDEQLRGILACSKLWATEEILFPTLAALAGFRIEQNPCSARYVKYRTPYTPRDVDAAVADPSAYFMHPVPRSYTDPIRLRVRHHFGQQRASRKEASPAHHPRQLWPLLRVARSIEGWLDDEEAELLAITVQEALEAPSERKRTLVEVGSYCGKATYVLASVIKAMAVDARVCAVDTFDGVLGALDRGAVRGSPSLDKFRRTLRQTEIEPWVETLIGRALELRWESPVDFLLIDGLHDYASIAQDFSAFEAQLTPSARVAFHDCAEYFPDVDRFVGELVASGGWVVSARAGTLKILQRLAPTIAAFQLVDEMLQTA